MTNQAEEFIVELKTVVDQIDLDNPDREALTAMKKALDEAAKEIERTKIRRLSAVETSGNDVDQVGYYAVDEFGRTFGPYVSKEEMLSMFGARKPAYWGRREGNFPSPKSTAQLEQPPSGDERKRARAAIDSVKTKLSEFASGKHRETKVDQGKRKIGLAQVEEVPRDDERSGLNAYEPPPKESKHPAVWDLVIKDIEDRDEFGQMKYGQRLKPFDGRDPLVDLYQELLDAVVYTRKAIYEREEMVNLLKELETFMERHCNVGTYEMLPIKEKLTQKVKAVLK